VATGQELIDEAVEVLEASSAIDHWQRHRERVEAEELLTVALGDRDWEPEDDVPGPAARRFRRLIGRRAEGEPVPYIRGYSEFRGLRVTVRRGVFVPRDSSEFLAEQAIRRLRRRSRPVVVDLATGAGVVALAVANEVPHAEVVGTDLSASAAALARANARRLGLRARFVQGDLFAGLPTRLRGAVDVITLHPPYVGRRELRELPREVLGYEPVESLTDHSPKGLALIERAAGEGRGWLSRGGWLLVEVSPDRSRPVATLLRRAGYAEVRSTKGGLRVTRVVTGRAGGPEVR
jgi:release factor glutamine methyltransferase